MLSFFWCTCWPLVTSVLKKKKVYLYNLTILKSDCFRSWVVWLLHIFWILIPYQIYGSHTFSPSVTCLFVLIIPLPCSIFLVWCSPIYLWLELSVSYSNNGFQDQHVLSRQHLFSISSCMVFGLMFKSFIQLILCHVII